MEWSNESCLNFIQHYELHPVLWNPKHNYYFSKTKKNEAWEIIAKNINRDIEDVKKKSQSLLGSYRREKAKGKRSMGTGTGMYNIDTYYNHLYSSIIYRV